MVQQIYHPYHLVKPSPWPFIGGSGALLTAVGAVVYFHYRPGWVLILGLIIITVIMIVWWRDVIREAAYQGEHTLVVKHGLKYGMILFILSEVCLFFSFFWVFFDGSLVSTIEIGTVWPPRAVDPLNPLSIPFLNTVVLLSSGASVTWTHHAIISGYRKQAIAGLFLTILLGLYFTDLQATEYYEAFFTISDSMYGSTFFLTTGAHGAHVLIGSSFLLVCLLRLLIHEFTTCHHFGFEAAVWYWHFVDVVWLFLFTFMYWWGS